MLNLIKEIMIWILEFYQYHVKLKLDNWNLRNLTVKGSSNIFGIIGILDLRGKKDFCNGKWGFAFKFIRSNHRIRTFKKRRILYAWWNKCDLTYNCIEVKNRRVKWYIGRTQKQR